MTVARHAGAALRMLAAGTLLLLAGCAPLASSAFDIDAENHASETLNDAAFRTFTLPVDNVREGVLGAMIRMSLKIQSSRKGGPVETIVARAKGRDIRIELESLSAGSTRMRALVKHGMFHDTATAMEIIQQTEKVISSA